MRTRQAIIAGVLALAALGLAVSPTAAQEAPTRAGFWGGFGMGWGSMGVGCGGARARMA
jgi:Spy/CpxP family protein refolding chaperone